MSKPPILALVPLVFLCGDARADIPDLPDSAIAAACAAAKEVDGCPACACRMLTSTQSRKEAADSSVPLGVVLEVVGATPDGNEYRAVHAAIGTAEALDHLGRMAEHRGGMVGHTEIAVSALRQGYQGCPDGCEFEAMGLIHPFEVTTTEHGIAPSADATTVTKRTTIVLCYAAMGGNTCSAMPIAYDEVLTYMEMAPGHKVPPPKKEGWKRSWKLGKKGDLELGAATGKRAGSLSAPKAFKISLIEIATHPDAVQLARWPTPPPE